MSLGRFSKTPALMACVLLACFTCRGQREVSMPAFVPPGAADAVVSGDKLPRSITCHDRIQVYVRGTGNEVQLYGTCGTVRVQGDRNFVWVDHEAQIAVEGNGNVIYIRTSTTRVSVQGAGNRFELRR